MIDGYNHFLNVFKEKYPDLFFKIADLPDSSKKGIINGMQSSRINLDDEKTVRKYFLNMPILRQFIEIEL